MDSMARMGDAIEMGGISNKDDKAEDNLDDKAWQAWQGWGRQSS